MNTPTRMNGGSAKLSLMARYDDLWRYNNSFLLKEIDQVGSIISLVKNFEETRVKWSKALKELRERDSFILKLEAENRDLKEQLQSIRMAFAREVKSKSLLKNEHDYLKKRFQLLKKLIMEGDMPNLTTMQSNTELMSVLNMEKPPKEDTDDGLLFDKSDDSIDEDAREIKIAKFESPQKEKMDINDDENSIFNTGFVLDKKTDDQIKTTLSTNSIMCHKSAQIYSRKNLLCSKLEPDRLDSRPHKLQEKTCLKPQVCTVCGKNISFCSQYVVCIECRGVGHNRCKNLLPKPCLPYISGQCIRKMISMGSTKNGFGKLLMISDFTNVHTRPCVPALLIHCCNEIDRRIGLAKKDLNRQNNGTDSSLVGLYRVCANSGDIRELRNKILEAKHGIPNLTTIIDIHTICGVVKMFLIDLQDALLTRVLWHDFVRASEHVLETKPKQIHESDSEKIDSGLDEDDKYSSDNDDDTEAMKILKGVIIDMPIANRDSLAFLMLHLNNVARAEAITKMNIASLSNIFAPTIVGNSEFRQLSSSSLMKEHPKQLIVIQALFLIQDHFWNGLLKDQNFDPFKDNPTEEIKINYYNKKCSKLAKISSSNLKSILNDNNMNFKNNQNVAGSSKPLTSIAQSKRFNKRGSIQSIMESLY